MTLATTSTTEFSDRYERLISILCDAAKNGCSQRLESEYSDLRGWFENHYGAVASRFRPYLDKRVAQEYRQANIDPLQQIYAPASLDQLLGTDNGALITRVSMISDAVFTWCAESEQDESERN